MRIKLDEIEKYASLYPVDAEGDEACFLVGEAAKVQGFLTKRQFLVITDWKTQRLKKVTRQNDEDLVIALTGKALDEDGDRDPMGILIRLAGVGLPTASCILHYCHRFQYPIIDYRVLWSLGIWHSNTSWAGWRKLCQETHWIHSMTGLSYRTIDRGLWQFSRMHQPKGA